MSLQSLIEKSKETPPLDYEAFYAQAFSFYQSNQLEQSAEIFTILCERKPLESRFWRGLAASFQESNQFEKALYAWAMIAILEPHDPYPHFHAAQCSCSLHRMNDALLALQEAKDRIQNDPEHPLYSPILTFENCWRNHDPR